MATSELFDPATGSWSPTGPMKFARIGAPAVTLADGRVLVFGSRSRPGAASTSTAEPRQRRDLRPGDGPVQPGRDASAATTRRPSRRSGAPNANPSRRTPTEIFPGTLVALPDGGAVLIGVDYYWKHEADLSRSFRYDAASNTWSEIGETWAVHRRAHGGRTGHRGCPNLAGSVAAALPDGRVLVAGGSRSTANGDPYRAQTTSARYYNPATNTWPDAPAMPTPSSGGMRSASPTGRSLRSVAPRLRSEDVQTVTPSRFIP